MAASSISLSPPPLSSIFFTIKPQYSHYSSNPSLQFTSSPILSTTIHSKRTIFSSNPPQIVSAKSTQIWRISATSEDVVSPDIPIEGTQQMIPSDDGGVSTIISVLLFIAFVGLTILSIGVIYIAVTDFLQKREREKFEKEEADKKSKKKGKKVAVRAKTGPRGFGQKIDEDDDD